MKRLLQLAHFCSGEGSKASAVAVDDLELAKAMMAQLQSAGLSTKLPILSWFRLGIRSLRRRWTELKSLLWYLRRTYRLSRLSNRESPIGSLPSDGTVILITIFDEGVLRQSNAKYRDTYFGHLPTHLERFGEKPIIFGSVVGDNEIAVARAVSWANGPRLVTMEQFLSPPVILRACWRALTVSFNVETPACSGPVAPDALRALIRFDLSSKRLQIAHGLLMRHAVEKLLSRNPNAHVLHMYENNPWERAVDLAAKSATPARKVTGYFHCSVQPGHLKFHLQREDFGVRPLPDRVVCTGPAAREALLSLGAYPEEMVLAGAALRGDALDELPPPRSEVRKKLRCILAVLEGLPAMVGFLRFLDTTVARFGDDIEIEVRAHPVLPLATLAQMSNVKIGQHPNLQESKHEDLIEDLLRADAVIYKGTTVALTAGYLGIPLLRFQDDPVLVDDPLIFCSSLKRVVSCHRDVPQALREFEELDTESYVRERDQLREYVRSYLAPLNAESLQDFL